MAIGTSIQLQDRMSGTLNKITAMLYSTVSAFQSVDTVSDQAFNPAMVTAASQEIHGYIQRIDQLEADLVDANKRIEQMQEETEQARKEADKLRNVYSMVGRVVAAIGIGHVVKDAIDYASDLTEVQNVVDTVFGDNSAVDAWAKNTLNAFGLNELSAKRFAGTMGAMLESSGLTGGAVQDMSTSLTELAGDMASFYNLDAEDAFAKIRSGISGETEPLKQLGINMSVANLEAYALAQGIEKSYSEMSQAEQVALRYGYLMNATANAQGDFARTSNSFANQTKLLKENWQEFTGSIAADALPVLAVGISMLNDAVSFVSKYWDVLAPIFAGMAGAVAVWGAFTLATKLATAAQAIYNAVQAANPTMLIVMAVVALIGVIMGLCQWIANATGVAESSFGVIAGAVMWLVGLVVNIFHGLLTFVAGIFVEFYNLFAKFANFVGNFLNNPVAAIEHLFIDLFDTVLGVVESIAGLIDSILGTDWSASVAGFRDKLQATADELLGEQKIYVEEITQEEALANMPFDRWDLTDSFDKGAAWGDGISEKVSGLFSAEDSLGGAGTDPYSGYEDIVADSLKGIESNTAATADAVDISNENLKYLRDSAEMEAINQFTTAEIKLDMTNNNNIASNMDIDGIVTRLSEGLREAMESAAEGVYA